MHPISLKVPSREIVGTRKKSQGKIMQLELNSPILEILLKLRASPGHCGAGTYSKISYHDLDLSKDIIRLNLNFWNLPPTTLSTDSTRCSSWPRSWGHLPIVRRFGLLSFASSQNSPHPQREHVTTTSLSFINPIGKIFGVNKDLSIPPRTTPSHLTPPYLHVNARTSRAWTLWQHRHQLRESLGPILFSE